MSCLNCDSQIIEKDKNPHIACNIYHICREESSRTWLNTLLLCIFLGGLGAHRFYTGYIGKGILQLLTAGGFGIWWVIDLIFIATGAYEDADGKILAKP